MKEQVNINLHPVGGATIVEGKVVDMWKNDAPLTEANVEIAWNDTLAANIRAQEDTYYNDINEFISLVNNQVFKKGSWLTV